MHKFPSINQFRQVIKAVQNKTYWSGIDENGDPVFDRTKELPKITYTGTVKLHGTNAGICYDTTTEDLAYYSRERVLSLTQDNAAFMLTMSAHSEYLRGIFRALKEHVSGVPSWTDASQIIIYGEWCGSGIQKGVAISGVPKMFVIFGVRYVINEETKYWANDMLSHSGIFDDLQEPFFHIDQFPKYTVEVDFNKPEYAQNEFVKLTEEVENECPVGKAFGITGIGEGIVWKSEYFGYTGSDFWFKTKGEKHSTSKVKTINPIDVEAIENINKFVDYAVTEARLEWALNNLTVEKLLPVEMSSMGDFIRIVYNDVMKEEMDVIVESQIDPKKLGSPLANVSRKWFIGKVNEGVGL